MKQRVISAVVLIVVAVTCVLLSPITRVLFFAAAGICCAYEFSRGLEKLGAACGAWVMYVYIAVMRLNTMAQSPTAYTSARLVF